MPFAINNNNVLASSSADEEEVIDAETKPSRDQNASSRLAQVGSSHSIPIGNIITQTLHLGSIYTVIFSTVIGALFSILAIITGKIIFPLLAPLYRKIRRALGYKDVEENLEIPNDNVWHRSFRTAALFLLNLFFIPGAILGYFQLWNHVHLGFMDNLGFGADMFIVGTAGALLIAPAITLMQYLYDKKQARKKQAQAKKDNDYNDDLVIDTWSKYLKAAVTVGNQAGLLTGLIISVATHAIPVVGSLPVFNIFLNTVLSAAGGIIGGVIALTAAPLIKWLDKRLAHYSLYQKFAEMADGANTNNPPSNRIKAGLQFFSAIGLIAGTLIGSAVPGIGTVIGMGFGAAIGGLLGGFIGFVSEPVINYFKDPHAPDLRTANPWSNRIRVGIYLGLFAGLVLNCAVPGLGLPLGIAIGSVTTGVLLTAIEPLYLRALTFIYGERALQDPDLLQDKTGNPWTARVPICATIGAAIGAGIGFAIGGPAGLALAAGIGGLVGAGAGACFTNKVRQQLKSWASPLFNGLKKLVETVCGETPQPKPAKKPAPSVKPQQPMAKLAAVNNDAANSAEPVKTKEYYESDYNYSKHTSQTFFRNSAPQATNATQPRANSSSEQLSFGRESSRIPLNP